MKEDLSQRPASTEPPRLGVEQLERLLEVGRRLVTELDLEALLRLILDAARELTGARFAALGVLDAKKRQLERFVYLGIDEETRARIGPLPSGHGILGELIRNPKALRLARISDHPRSYGFPAEHCKHIAQTSRCPKSRRIRSCSSPMSSRYFAIKVARDSGGKGGAACAYRSRKASWTALA